MDFSDLRVIMVKVQVTKIILQMLLSKLGFKIYII